MKRRGPVFTVGFDTEDDGQGHPFLWCFAHEHGASAHRTAAEALRYLERLTEAKKVEGCAVQVWATNLEYDLCNLFDRDRIAEVSLRFGRSYLCGARWRGADFRDTVRHLPASVAQLGELVGLKKREGKLFDSPRGKRTFERYLSRCKRDAAITYQAARRFGEAYAEFGQPCRMTLASTALRIWQDRYWKKDVRRPSPEVWQAALESYHGGRTQAFAHGTFPDVTAIDVASMFPWAMVAAPLPLPWGLMRRVGRGADIRGAGLYRVQVTSELERPQLPVRTREGTIYPNGRWSGWYVGEELQAFQRAGGRARVLQGIEFGESCEPFKGYVRAMYAKKQRARGMARVMYKLLLNSLYGKFGQQGRQVRAVTVSKWLAMEHRPLEAREWNGLVIYSTESAPPPWSNNVWPAFVTARARVKLADELERIERPLYCDTDSIIFQGASPRYRSKATRIGDFELRGRFRNLLLVGKKEYALDRGRGAWDCHAKGIPFAERMRYLKTGLAEFDRPARMREAARDGSTVNVWKRVRKQRRVKVTGSSLSADGTLAVGRISASTVR